MDGVAGVIGPLVERLDHRAPGGRASPCDSGLHNVGAALGFERGSLSVHQVLARPPAGPPPGRLRVRDSPV